MQQSRGIGLQGPSEPDAAKAPPVVDAKLNSGATPGPGEEQLGAEGGKKEPHGGDGEQKRAARGGPSEPRQPSKKRQEKNMQAQCQVLNAMKARLKLEQEEYRKHVKEHLTTFRRKEETLQHALRTKGQLTPEQAAEKADLEAYLETLEEGLSTFAKKLEDIERDLAEVSNEREQNQRHKAEMEEKNREEEERAKELRRAREAEQQRRLAVMTAEAEKARQLEQEERARLRKELGLSGDAEVDTLVAKCSLRRGFSTSGCSCCKSGQDFEILERDKYMQLTCTDGCRLLFHHACWRELEKHQKDVRGTTWKLKHGAECLTEECPGSISYAAQQQGPLKKPTDVHVLVSAEEKRVVEEGDKEDGRLQSKRKQRAAVSKNQKIARENEVERPQRSDIKHHLKRQLPAGKKEMAKDGAAAGPVSLAADPAPPPVEAPKPPPVDVSKLDLDALKPLERDEGADMAGPSKAKKERRHKDLKTKHVVQPAFQHPPLPHQQQWPHQEVRQILPPSVALSGGPSSDFFTEFERKQEQERGNQGEEAWHAPPDTAEEHSTTIDTSRQLDFPNLEEASLADHQPELFKYLSNMEDILKSLRIENTNELSSTVLVEHIDTEQLAEEGAVPAAHVRDLLAAFGHFDKYRFFPLLSLACVQFKKQEHAENAVRALHDAPLGNRNIQAKHMRLFPSDTLLRHRMGEDVWQMFLSSEADMSSRSKDRAEQKAKTKLNVAAREFRPSSTGSTSAPALPKQVPQDQACGPDGLLACLREFQATEVIGCNTHSLDLYIKEGQAFGVLPAQLVNAGFGTTPTALVMYQIDSNELHGVWKIADRQVTNREQVVVVKLVQQCIALEEAAWSHLLEYEEGDGLEEYEGYSYPQLLDAERTRQLLVAFSRATAGQAQEDAPGSSQQQSSPQRPRSSPQLPAEGEAEGGGERKPAPVAPLTAGAELEAAALQRFKQAREDEEFARRLQEELNQPGPASADKGDVLLALRLQEEERAAATPSYSSAVRQDTYRRPHEVAPLSPAAPAASAGLFSDFFPLEASSRPQPQPAQTQREAESAPPAQTWKPENESSTRPPSVQRPDARYGGAANGWDSESQKSDGWGETLSRASGEALASPRNSTAASESANFLDFLPKPAATRPIVRRPAYQPPALARPAALAPLQAQSLKDDPEDLLSSLVGMMLQPKAPSSAPAPSDDTAGSHGTENGRGRGPARAGSAVSLSSMGSEREAESSRRAAKPLLCPICSERSANFLSQPCKHWGPCTGCVPSAADKDELYPVCLHCQVPSSGLIRVYQR